MAGTGASSPFIKDEPEDHFFSSSNQRYMGGNQQGFGQQFQPFGSHSGSINPNDLTMGGGGVAIPNGGYGSSYQNGFVSQPPNSGSTYAKGGMSSTFADDELLDTMSPMADSHSNQAGMHGNGQDFGMDGFNSYENIYPGHNGATPLSVNNGHYSSTPDGDPIQSPFLPGNFTQQQLLLNRQNFGGQLHSPASYGSPFQGSDLNGARTRPGAVRRGSSNQNKLGASFPTPIRTHRHQKSASSQWDQTPNSLNSFPGSEFSSPVQGVHPNPQISDLLKGGVAASMPTKLANSPGNNTSQEMKRRRRRESHNLVERRRRDNINERIQELSHLVPLHRLEDEKVRKALQNNSPLSPTLAGLSQPPTGMSPPQATSGLAGQGGKAAARPGNITTGIPVEEKDKGPNKGDILNGAVSWTRDLMWMLYVKMQQQEELNNIIREQGGTPPFQETEDELRMRTELMDAMVKNDASKFQYSRAPGTGLRVPKHTDVKGDPVGSSSSGQNDTSLSPENHSTGGDAGIGGPGQYWSGHNSGGSGPGSISFKEEDEYGMDLTQ